MIFLLIEYFIYDDACHIKKFLNKRKFKTERGIALSLKKHFLDKLHFSNHIDKWCLENCNPYNERALDKVNTVVCEQFNFWLGGFKYMVKHMNYHRFHFFLFIMFNFYNFIKQKENEA